jgi:hypothetical protein
MQCAVRVGGFTARVHGARRPARAVEGAPERGVARQRAEAARGAAEAEDVARAEVARQHAAQGNASGQHLGTAVSAV